MKVYVVTAGCYSDYHIEAVFTDPDMAKAFANIDSDREVEEYDADSVKIAEAGIKARIWYDPKHNEISGIDTGDYVQERWRPWPDEYMYRGLCVYRKLSARTLKDVQMHGKKSPLLLKVMQDAWAQYKAEHMDELKKEEEEDEDEGKLITVGPEEASKAFGILANNYNLAFATTSMETVQCNAFKADAVVNEIVHDFWKDGIKLPTSEDMRELREELIKKTVEENVKVNEHDELR